MKKDFQALWNNLWTPTLWDSPRGSFGDDLALILLEVKDQTYKDWLKLIKHWNGPLNIPSPLLLRLGFCNLSGQWKERQLRTEFSLHLPNCWVTLEATPSRRYSYRMEGGCPPNFRLDSEQATNFRQVKPLRFPSAVVNYPDQRQE